MKKIILFFIFFSLTTKVFAAYLYVTDSFEVTMRTGMGTQHKIVAMVPSGEKLDVLEYGDQWTKVKRKSGLEGYILTRFLKDEQPYYQKLTSLTSKFENLSSENEKNKEELKSLREENSELKIQLNAVRKDFEELNEKYISLKKEAAGYLDLKKEYEEKSKLLEERNIAASELKSKLMERNVKIFLAGAGVLLAGFIIGLSTKKKKTSRLY
ncbi:MAG: TIGR04211 family SH3 domain-containing protein [Desulfobacteraceae bacterium]|nr:TIGR04211 family SH3 domain-containing protein [Desulfobacteraceae bacterium]